MGGVAELMGAGFGVPIGNAKRFAEGQWDFWWTGKEERAERIVFGVSERQLYGSGGKKAWILRDAIDNGGTEETYIEALTKHYRDEGKSEDYIEKYTKNKAHRRKSGTVKSWTIARDVKKFRQRKEFGYNDRDVNKLLKGDTESRLKRLHLIRKNKNDEDFIVFLREMLSNEYGSILNKKFLSRYWDEYPNDMPQSIRQ